MKKERQREALYEELRCLTNLKAYAAYLAVESGVLSADER